MNKMPTYTILLKSDHELELYNIAHLVDIILNTSFLKLLGPQN